MPTSPEALHASSGIPLCKRRKKAGEAGEAPLHDQASRPALGSSNDSRCSSKTSNADISSCHKTHSSFAPASTLDARNCTPAADPPGEPGGPARSQSPTSNTSAPPAAKSGAKEENAATTTALASAPAAAAAEVVDFDEDEDQAPLSPLRAVLKKFWGFDGFREGQEEAIQAVLKGNDALVIMPTGGGKSLTYMLPGLLLEGVVLIISPLIALIEDQLRRMKTRGLSACSFNSTLTARQRQEIIAQLLRLPVEGPQQKAIKFLFVTPEQIVTSAFQGVLRQLQQQKQPNGQAQRGPQLLKGGGRGVALIAVDEAHCISSWGHDFRASYRRLGVLRSLLPETPILACTATATAAVQRDICSSLLLKDPVIVRLSFNRPNIYYEVRLKSLLPSSEYTDESECLDREGETEFAAADLAREIKEHHPNDLGIVYCLKKKDCETLAAYLSSVGIPAAAYHAGLPEKRRQSLQQRWMEAFYQESGRAGRDGLPARSILYFSMHDFNLLGFVLQQQHEQQVAAATASATAAAGADGKQLQGRLQQIRKEAAEQHERQMEKLKACVAFCRLVGCRRRYLLEQFGEVYAPAAATVAGIPSGRCCDNCSDPAAAKSRANALRSREVTAASERRKQSWQKAFEARPAALEIETQDVPDGSPSRSDRGGSFFAGRLQRGGRVVYKNTASSERQKIPEDIRKKGLSAVMRELERREEQQETSSSNKKPHHSLFAEFRSAAKLGGSNSRPATAASTRPAVRSDAEALRPATQSFKKTLGLCRPLGLQRTRPSP
ncbi:ATP-dependent DNA helicase Q-like 3 [Cyclospora cayetanensis]|uniref:ATP-dependent DNA helicase n=1 Tax=Cyclospora cayetanensis TaxID=88456 RepID=A0A6P6RS79_9EIME|nr:ATP-dependent DNA helicase Q-like 3 [Cyclospora cayetanensis]